MKKAKAPSAKTLARKAQEAALIAWAKQQHAKFQADLREMFARERQEKQQAEEAKRKQAGPVIPTKQEVKAVSEAARKYIDSLDTPQGKLGNAPAAPKIAPDKNSLYRKVDAVLAAKKQRQESEDIYAQMQKQQMGGAEPEKKVYDRKQYSTPKQAYDYVNTLGAGGTSYTNISMDLAHDTNEALTEYCNNITSAGLTPKIPFIIKFSDVLVDAEEKKINQRTGQNLSLQAFYNKAWLVLRSSFNPTKMQAEAVLNHNNREASTANSHHVYFHEIGHWVHETQYPQSFANCDKIILTPSEQGYILKHVSKYPDGYRAENGIYIKEVFAELHAMIADGQKLDLTLQSIYDKIRYYVPPKPQGLSIFEKN